MFQTPITGTVNRLLTGTRNSGLGGRITKNIRTIGSFPSSDTDNDPQNTAINPQNRHEYHQRQDAVSFPKTPLNRFGAARHTNIHRRSMVTITQTKSSDSAPLFSTHVVDDVTSSGPDPIYVANEDMDLIVTENCLKQVERLLNQRREGADQLQNHDDGYFLRVFVDAGGCSGFQYQFEVDNEIDEDEDIVAVMAKIGEDTMNPRVVVDETSMGFLEGSTIDYVIEMIKSAFVVSDNPQSESACGCGSSFAMKNFGKFGASD